MKRHETVLHHLVDLYQKGSTIVHLGETTRDFLRNIETQVQQQQEQTGFLPREDMLVLVLLKEQTDFLQKETTEVELHLETRTDIFQKDTRLEFLLKGRRDSPQDVEAGAAVHFHKGQGNFSLEDEAGAAVHFLGDFLRIGDTPVEIRLCKVPTGIDGSTLLSDHPNSLVQMTT